MTVVPRSAGVAPEPVDTASTRSAYRDVLVELMLADERIVCLDTDTGLFARVDWGAAARRYVSLGIAEHNAMGVAAGLAKAGHIPFVSTMAAFAATRALEAIKIDIALNDLPVRIAATHSGLSAGHLGPTHHSLEDLAVMRLLPNVTVLSPADAATTGQLVRDCVHRPGPVYLRLGRDAGPAVGPGTEPPRIGRARALRTGADVALVATGPHPVWAALQASAELARDGIGAAVLDVHTVKPLDVAALAAAARTVRGFVTVEEHWAAGGLGSAVAEVAGRLGFGIPVLPVAAPDTFLPYAGDHRDLVQRAGITPEAVVARARCALRLHGQEGGRR